MPVAFAPVVVKSVFCFVAEWCSRCR